MIVTIIVLLTLIVAILTYWSVIMYTLKPALDLVRKRAEDEIEREERADEEWSRIAATINQLENTAVESELRDLPDNVYDISLARIKRDAILK